MVNAVKQSQRRLFLVVDISGFVICDGQAIGWCLPRDNSSCSNLLGQSARYIFSNKQTMEHMRHEPRHPGESRQRRLADRYVTAKRQDDTDFIIQLSLRYLKKHAWWSFGTLKVRVDLRPLMAKRMPIKIRGIQENLRLDWTQHSWSGAMQVRLFDAEAIKRL